MIVAGLQLDLAWEEPEENFRRAQAQAERAVAAGAQLLVLPEMFNTGFSMEAARCAAAAERTRAWLAALARSLACHVGGGFAEPAPPDAIGSGARPRNAFALFGPDGVERLHYQKLHPFSLAGEARHYAGGEALPTATIDGVRVTAVICYDLRFPELFRAAAARTDLFLVPANWPAKRSHAWQTLLAARAIESQCFVLGVNRVGEAGGEPHRGDSALLDPFGVARASASERPAIVVGEVDAAEVARVRERFPFLADRRPELYPRL
ncbi:MAG: carbon-nitrogen family hydrolase [Planctomycetes bacterium]|nr:carbon-nitrogen family hydrolase [Planctomycetota bacterium]